MAVTVNGSNCADKMSTFCNAFATSVAEAPKGMQLAVVLAV